ncbi:MAG: co-chaperone GroES [Actinobacteria bacterium]|nr:co-chaperone GroES [Actinomycetota bacterium]
MNLKPLGDRVIVKPADAEEKTQSGLFIPDTAKEKPQRGEVVAVGDGKLKEDGTRVAIDVKVGDTVIFSKYGGSEVKIDGVEYKILDAERDIIAVVVD